MSNLENFSEQSMVAGMKAGVITYEAFVAEIKRRITAGEAVHPYHAACAGMVR